MRMRRRKKRSISNARAYSSVFGCRRSMIFRYNSKNDKIEIISNSCRVLFSFDYVISPWGLFFVG